MKRLSAGLRPSIHELWLARRSCVLAALTLLTLSPTAFGQATSRHCEDGTAKEEQAGPACLLAHESLGSLNAESVYWHLDKYPSVDQAQANKGRSGSVIKAFGSVWLFTVGPLASRPVNGEHVAQVGPILVDRNTSYDAEFLKSTFTPGMTAPIHVHSGPEAFYAISGDSCLETPDGVQVARGPGNSMTVRGGPPMLLMALGNEPRKGFALILHDASLPPTTLVHQWTPKGLCTQALKATAQSQPARSADAPPAYPWHLADIWWTLPSHERLDSLSIAFDISNDVPDDVDLYIAPLGLVTAGGANFYGGVQTHVAGWPNAAERTLVPLGRGTLFSRWATGQAIDLDYAKGPPGTHFEAGGYEGNFVSVRNPCHWHKGRYIYAVSREVTGAQSWLSATVQDANGKTVCTPGSLRLDSDDARLGSQLGSFVEVYGSASAIPHVTVTFHPPLLNGHAVAQSNVIVNYPENGVPHAPRFAAVTVAGDSLQIAVTPRPLNDGSRQQTLSFSP